MEFNRKTAADKLLQIADVLEKHAHENAFFVCDMCNHTASLSTINVRRKQAAEKLDMEIGSPVGIDDKTGCAVAGCDGTMKYVETDESSRYFVNAADDDEEDTGEEDDIKAEDIFAPVNDQEKKKEDKGNDPGDVDGEINLDFGGEDPEEPQRVEDAPGEEEPTKDKPEPAGKEDIPEGAPEDSVPDEGVVEEEVLVDEPKPKKPKKKKDKPDDEKASFPKEPSPKFEKMPKDASENPFWRSVARYAQ